ncbi:MAG: hypothetical protein J6J24_04505 [Clostridia bacterium]|nr:hypothetical protein [Clostridia bacterium]
MNYKELIEKIKTISRKQEQVGFLFKFLLETGEYDYLCLEIEKLKKLDVNTFADLYDEDLQEQAFKLLEKKTSISKELKEYFATKQWEKRSRGEQDTQFKDGILVKGVCNDYSNFIKRVLTEIGIDCERCAGKTPLNHAWNIISIENNPLHYDITYAMYARDKKIDKSNPTDWFGITTEQLQRLQPERTILSLTREK